MHFSLARSFPPHPALSLKSSSPRTSVRTGERELETDFMKLISPRPWQRVIDFVMPILSDMAEKTLKLLQKSQPKQGNNFTGNARAGS